MYFLQFLCVNLFLKCRYFFRKMNRNVFWKQRYAWMMGHLEKCVLLLRSSMASHTHVMCAQLRVQNGISLNYIWEALNTCITCESRNIQGISLLSLTLMVRLLDMYNIVLFRIGC